jgi:hypothetical protein
MNKATRNHEKKIRDLVAKHLSRGTSLEEIGRRIWICYGYLNEVKDGSLIVNMHAGPTVLATESQRVLEVVGC